MRVGKRMLSSAKESALLRRESKSSSSSGVHCLVVVVVVVVIGRSSVEETEVTEDESGSVDCSSRFENESLGGPEKLHWLYDGTAIGFVPADEVDDFE